MGVEKLATKVILFMNKISVKLCKFSPWNSLNLDVEKMCEPCNSLLAEVRESQGTWVPKNQGKSGNFAKKNWVETMLLRISSSWNVNDIGNKQTNIALFIKLNFYFNKRVAGDLLS